MRGTSAYNYAVNNAGRIKTLTIGTTLKATQPFAWLRAFVAQNDSQDRFAGRRPSRLTL